MKRERRSHRKGLFDLQTEETMEVENLQCLQFLDLNRMRRQDAAPGAAARDTQAPFLLKCCRVDYNKETNRLEIRKGEYVGKVVMRDMDAPCSEEDTQYDENLVERTDQSHLPSKCNRYVRT